MFDAIFDDQLDDTPDGAPEDRYSSAQESKLNFLLSQSGNPDSKEYLDKLDRVAEVLSQKLNPYNRL